MFQKLLRGAPYAMSSFCSLLAQIFTARGVNKAVARRRNQRLIDLPQQMVN
jgi:hypothetical protein